MKRKKRSLHARLRGLARRGVKALFWAALLLLAVRANISFFRGAFERALEKIRSDPAIKGPKRLNVYGAPYVWAILKTVGAAPSEKEEPKGQG